MSVSTSLYRLQLSKLENFDRDGITDPVLAALSDQHRLDQGLAYLLEEHADKFGYLLKAEGQILPGPYPEVVVEYLTPPKLKERLQDLDCLDLDSIRNEIPPEDRDLCTEKNLQGLREYLQGAVKQSLGLLIVKSY